MKSLPRIERKDHGFSFLLEDKAYVILGVEAHNSACTSRNYMEHVWKKARELHCNTVLAPVYWELLEPEENNYAFSMVEELLEDARKNGLKLVLLWFGSWKNGHSTYAPAWVKTDPKRFPRVKNEAGQTTKTLSLFGSELLQVEKRSFVSFMKWLKQLDDKEQTVIAVQVENELGVLETTRDFSDKAAEAFAEFDGPNEEAFMALHYAKHLDALAKAGKEVYALPMFTNAWQKEYENDRPGTFPCGGPLPEVLDIWKENCPHLDILSPDIYSFEFDKIAAAYVREDNPLFIPETRRDKWVVPYLYRSIGTYHALCYSPFGAESIGEDKSFINQKIHTNASDTNVSSPVIKDYLAQSYEMISRMMPMLTERYGSENLLGFYQEEGRSSSQFSYGNYRIRIEYYHEVNDDNAYIPGAGMLLAGGSLEDAMLFVGYGYKAYVEPLDAQKQIDFLTLEKGIITENGEFQTRMWLNGDEQHVQMEEEPTVVKVQFYEY